MVCLFITMIKKLYGVALSLSAFLSADAYSSGAGFEAAVSNFENVARANVLEPGMVCRIEDMSRGTFKYVDLPRVINAQSEMISALVSMVRSLVEQSRQRVDAAMSMSSFWANYNQLLRAQSTALSGLGISQSAPVYRTEGSRAGMCENQNANRTLTDNLNAFTAE